MKYPSKYSNGKEVTAAQYIVEMICERIAKKNKKDLHYRFWISPEWEKEYKGQIAAAHKLLKKYDFNTIVHALKSTEGSKIYSLRAPHLSDIIDKTALIRKQQPILQTKNIERNLLDTGKIKHNKLTIIDKLKEIDNGITR
jgi:hypothetical protein